MSLNLRVDKYLDSDGGPPPTVFATIYAVDPESGKKRRDVSVRREQVPISHNAHDLKSVSLAPGHYVVEVTMPSGDVLSDRIDVPSTPDVSLVLKAEDSPHEWLGWQHLVGNVSSVSQTPEQRARRRPSRGTEPEQRHGASRRALPRREAIDKTIGKARGGVGPRASVDIPGGDVRETAARAPEPSPPVEEAAQPTPTLKFLNTPLPDIVVPLGSPWTALGQVLAGDTQLSTALNSGNVPVDIQPVVADSERAVYRVVRGPGGAGGATSLQGPLSRQFISVPRANAVELVSLPTPWFIADTGREAVIEIVVQRSVGGSDFATSLTVRDDRLGVLLGYLASGALGAAREIAQAAQDFLAAKEVNSLAAAAGAYALVGTMSDTLAHEWHAWVNNLYNWFPHLPDAAIQLAQLHLRLRRTPEDITKARELFKEAYFRGLPFYSMGMRWLLEGLEKVGRSDPESETMRKAVHGLAWRIHALSPFTILRLERR